MRYLIIGLGIYGSNLARDLTDMGHEVIGADFKAANVDAIKDYITTAYNLDTTDEAALSALPVKNVDLVIVAIGENFGASIKTVAILRKMGVENIYARAIDELHQSILEGLKVKRILAPEQRAAHDLVNEISLSTDVTTLRVGRRTFVMRFKTPTHLMGLPYSQLTPDMLDGLRLVAAARDTVADNILGIPHSVTRALPFISTNETTDNGKPRYKSGKSATADYSDNTESIIVEAGDTLVCIGTIDAYRAFFRSNS